MRGVGLAGAVLPISPQCTAPDGPFRRGVKPAGGAVAVAGPATKSQGRGGADNAACAYRVSSESYNRS